MKNTAIMTTSINQELKEKIDTTTKDLNVSKSAYTRSALIEKLNDDGNRPARIAASIQLITTVNELKDMLDEENYTRLCKDMHTLMAFIDRGGDL